jgi:HEPN domain-containing protein
MNAAEKPDDPRAWLARARSNLLLAESGQRHGIFLEDLCFEAQQAAEKALKAVCVYYKIEFPKTHSMTTLTALLEQAGVELPLEVREADLLTSFAVQARYPDWGEAVTDPEYQHALVIARHVIAWADKIITEKSY